eukprot:TRINITY_DN112225_c0_g1_i1.p1 TRINITY_DN112225_c0_g1~~TRINITY_DN112225_c0_g1_i1.p1  ORF type:complete len:665 (-),score=176.59 TRINITY_DN112225_c0_g1_i1:62-2056(-)
MRVEAMQQAVDSADALADFGFMSFCMKVMWAMRFEVVFATGVLFLWMTGILRRSKSADSAWQAQQTKAQSAHAGRRPAAPAERKVASQSQPTWRSSSPGTAQSVDSQDSDNTTELLQAEVMQLRDAAWVSPRLLQLAQTNLDRALEVYRLALKAGLQLAEIPDDERQQLLLALLTAAIRLGRAEQAVHMLRDIHHRGVTAGPSLGSSAIKLLTARHCFSDALKVLDFLTEKEGFNVGDKSVWSCLLFCAVEVRAFNRCHGLFEKLQRNGEATQKDFWNMIRCGSAHGDWRLMLRLVQQMRAQELEVDSVVYNTALATCVSADKVEEARRLLDEMHRVGGVADVITYNTLMKGYAKSGRMDECFKIYELMTERSLAPSQVTFGILLDGCINNNDVDRASQVFDIMTKDGCPMNTVLYTTLIKGFAREQKVGDAMRIYERMQRDRNVQPDLITFSILLKANCDAGRLDSALELLDTMLKSGLRPDEVIFNNLLTGCAKQANAELAQRLYNDMVSSGIRPSNATFSIMIRLYSQCKMLDEAVEMLQTQPHRHKVEVELRLFSQLIQSCIRARQGRRAVEVYELLCSHGPVSAATHSSLLGMCAKLNMYDTAAELLEIAAEKGGRVDARDAHLVLDGARKKKRQLIADSLVSSLKKLGMPLDDKSAKW